MSEASQTTPELDQNTDDPAANALLSVHGLVKIYGRRTVVDGVSAWRSD